MYIHEAGRIIQEADNATVTMASESASAELLAVLQGSRTADQRLATRDAIYTYSVSTKARQSPFYEVLQREEAVVPSRVVAHILVQHLRDDGQLALPGVECLCDGGPMRPGMIILRILCQAPA